MTGTPTLRQLRIDSGKTITEILTAAKHYDNDFPESHPGLLRIEDRGTSDYWKIVALSKVYRIPVSKLAIIAMPKNTVADCDKNPCA